MKKHLAAMSRFALLLMVMLIIFDVLTGNVGAQESSSPSITKEEIIDSIRKRNDSIKMLNILYSVSIERSGQVHKFPQKWAYALDSIQQKEKITSCEYSVGDAFAVPMVQYRKFYTAVRDKDNITLLYDITPSEENGIDFPTSFCDDQGTSAMTSSSLSDFNEFNLQFPKMIWLFSGCYSFKMNSTNSMTVGGEHGQDTLSMFLTENAGEPTRTVDQDNNVIWDILYSDTSPDTGTISVKLSVDETKGFMPVFFSVDMDKGTNSNLKVSASMSVLESKCHHGTWFPMKVLSKYHDSKECQETLEITYTIDKISVNKDLAQDVFDIKIPEYTSLFHYPPVSDKDGSSFCIADVYGKNNTILKTFNDPNEYSSYIREQCKDVVNGNTNAPIKKNEHILLRIILAFSGIVLIFTAIYLRTRSSRISE